MFGSGVPNRNVWWWARLSEGDMAVEAPMSKSSDELKLYDGCHRQATGWKRDRPRWMLERVSMETLPWNEQRAANGKIDTTEKWWKFNTLADFKSGRAVLFKFTAAASVDVIGGCARRMVVGESDRKAGDLRRSESRRLSVGLDVFVGSRLTARHLRAYAAIPGARKSECCGEIKN